MIKKFTIFGERNSGTNYLRTNGFEHNIDDIPFTTEYGGKHWFIKDFYPRGKPNNTTDNECIKSLDDSDDTLFVFIVRNSFDWLGAMLNNSHHLSLDMNFSSLFNFIRCPCISYVNRSERIGIIEESKNIIILRNEKNKHFYNLRNKVKYFSLIRLEHFKEDFIKMVDEHKLPHSKNITFPDYRPPSRYNVDEGSRNFIIKNLNNRIDEIYSTAKA